MPAPGQPAVATATSVDTLDVTAVHALLAAASAADGRAPLSDHLRLELAAGGGPGFAAVTLAEDGRLSGYAQLATINGIRNIELVVAPDHRADPAVARRVLAMAIQIVARDGGGPVQWWAVGASPAEAALADDAGLSMTRELHQLRVALPIDRPVTVTTRPFEASRDADAFLAVNNRAFAAHPEQGGWTRQTLAQREHEPWFDPAGFLLHERDGRLAAFCWTKLHDRRTVVPAGHRSEGDGGEPDVLGEIYVIAVDPDFQGLGLGSQLTLAGLASIAARRVDVGMLYVDGGNTVALATYRSLGFTVHHTDRAFTADVAAAP